MRKHPYLVIRMVVDALFALCFLALFVLVAGLGSLGVLIRGGNWVNSGSALIPPLISLGFVLDLLQTRKRIKLGQPT